MRVPLDHVRPDGREISVGVIRIRAALAAWREGSLFFNKGGPGTHPGPLLRSMGEVWSRLDANDPGGRDKRQLAERYDLIAVIPRGLAGSGDMRCGTVPQRASAFLPSHQDDANWRLIVDDAEALVEACTASDQARYVNTEQHAHDMDWVRRALGDERLNFYGISYGGMVGAWYASIYPAHTGRLLLDSSMDIMHGYRAATDLLLAARNRAFQENVVAPLLRDPVAHGLGRDPDAIATAIAAFPSWAREAWVEQLTTVPRLAAALRLVGWAGNSQPQHPGELIRFINREWFSSDPALNRSIRREADSLVRSLFYAAAGEPSSQGDAASFFVRLAVACNDVAWPRSDADIRESARRNIARYFNFTGEETFEELACSRWGGPSARRPDLAALGRAAPFLLIQSEKDTSTPLQGAQHILDGFPNARMLLVRRSDQHGVFNFTTSPCIERTAAHYLLTGELPATPSRSFTCSDAFDNPVNALPGTPALVAEPTPVNATLPGTAPAPVHHDEL
ncbi:MAG TPA: alpha/beta fold hydrolase [Luteibacter sp.]|nr:alpha/beta fold hydrolase [Luteibacter sp.]